MNEKLVERKNAGSENAACSFCGCVLVYRVKNGAEGGIFEVLPLFAI
jgi:hypothetical protein